MGLGHDEAESRDLDLQFRSFLVVMLDRHCRPRASSSSGAVEVVVLMKAYRV